MNKAELIERLASKTDESKATCKDCLEGLLDIIGEELKRGRDIVLTGFGTFSVTKRKARTGINPATGKKIQIPAKKVPKFKAGKVLKEMVAK